MKEKTSRNRTDSLSTASTGTSDSVCLKCPQLIFICLVLLCKRDFLSICARNHGVSQINLGLNQKCGLVDISEVPFLVRTTMTTPSAKTGRDTA